MRLFGRQHNLCLPYWLFGTLGNGQTLAMAHNRPNPKTDPDRPLVYQIRIKGQLGREWTDWFGGLTITLQENGDTLLTGPVVDQAALHGLLRKVRDLGMPLVSVSPVEGGQAQQPGKTLLYRSKKGDLK